MSIALDSNVVIALLTGPERDSERASQTLEKMSHLGALVLPPIVYAELLAGPGRVPADVEDLLEAARVRIAWEIPPTVWVQAGKAYAVYAERRRRSGGGTTRRILADFLIGAHAADIGGLVTVDVDFFRTNFPALHVVSA